MSTKANKKRLDDWAAAQIAKAKYFTAVMFLGHPAGVDRRRASSLEEARCLKQIMISEYAGKNYGRGVLLYAVTSDNVTVPIDN